MKKTRLVLAAAALLLAAAGRNPAEVPLSRMNLPWWHARFEAKQAEMRAHKPALLMLGDSIFQNWEQAGPEDWRNFKPVWDHFYGDRNAIDLGFKGDTTASLLWRIQNGEVPDGDAGGAHPRGDNDGAHPRAAVMLIGANNFGRVHWDAAQTLGGIDAIIAELHRRQPQMPVVLLSILPSERSAWVSEQTAIANHALATRYANDRLVHFVDVTPVFAPGGQFDESLFLDKKLTPPDPPLHPTAEGQRRMAAAYEKVLAKLLGDAPKTQ